jgi:hypothetical protein
MTRVKAILSICFVALFGALAGASAADLPASQTPAGSLARQVDYQSCTWRDGYRLCRTYDDDDEDEDVDVDDDDYAYDDYPAYAYYGAPGIYLGIGGFGHGHGGGFHHGGGGHGRH